MIYLSVWLWLLVVYLLCCSLYTYLLENISTSEDIDMTIWICYVDCTEVSIEKGILRLRIKIVIILLCTLCTAVVILSYSVAEPEPPGAVTFRVELEPIFLFSGDLSRSCHRLLSFKAAPALGCIFLASKTGKPCSCVKHAWLKSNL